MHFSDGTDIHHIDNNNDSFQAQIHGNPRQINGIKQKNSRFPSLFQENLVPLHAVYKSRQEIKQKRRAVASL